MIDFNSVLLDLENSDIEVVSFGGTKSKFLQKISGSRGFGFGSSNTDCSNV